MANFNISLSALMHLGRNLYRNLIAILGEAIFNSWDADASNIQITLDQQNNRLIITDNGEGMSSSDFKNKFLLAGYSKRGGGKTHSPKGRPYTGREGIGKLAFLSSAQKISIYTKKEGGELTGGTINNNALDEILHSESLAQDEQLTKEYRLDNLDPQSMQIYDKELPDGHGTVLIFEGLSSNMSNDLQSLRTQIALYFRFSLLDPDFQISLNGEPISEKDLQELADDTQFVWKSRGFQDPYLDLIWPFKGVTEVDASTEDSDIKFDFFVASVAKPSNLNIYGTGEKTGIDLFVNGRMRETNIMKRHKTFSTHISTSYLYGQVHCNFLDDNDPERLTSSREENLEGNRKYTTVLRQLDKILKQIRSEWNILRKEHSQADESSDDEAS